MNYEGAACWRSCGKIGSESISLPFSLRQCTPCILSVFPLNTGNLSLIVSFHNNSSISVVIWSFLRNHSLLFGAWLTESYTILCRLWNSPQKNFLLWNFNGPMIFCTSHIAYEKIHGLYHIARKFGGDFDLASWQLMTNHQIKFIQWRK